jgi:hypothetical protein
LTGPRKVYKIDFIGDGREKKFPLLSIGELEKGNANPWKR